MESFNRIKSRLTKSSGRIGPVNLEGLADTGAELENTFLIEIEIFNILVDIRKLEFQGSFF